MVCVGGRLYLLTWRNRLYTAKIGGRRGLRRLRVTAPDGQKLRRPTYIGAGPAHVFVKDLSRVAAISDGRVRWVRTATQWNQTPVPLGTDRVLFRSGNSTHDSLHCADAESGKHLP